MFPVNVFPSHSQCELVTSADNEPVRVSVSLMQSCVTGSAAIIGFGLMSKLMVVSSTHTPLKFIDTVSVVVTSGTV